MRRSRDAAERANRAKDDLIAHASHELRTPLHAVLGFAEILELDGVEHEALVQIRENGRLLLTMIDDLLELGRISADDAATQDREEFGAVVQRVVANLLPIAAVQQTALEFDAASAPAVLMRSPLRLQQVLHCVASAALLSAGAAGHVDVSLTISAEGPDVRFVCSGVNRRAPIGLGLALARSLAAAMSATVHIAEDDRVVTLGVSVSQPANP